MRHTLKLEKLVKEFEFQKRTVRAVNEVSLEFPAGAFVTLLGPSGCGKTTVLRMIAGLEMPTGGAILLDGQDVTDVPPNQRETAMVFQSYALFPHMTVFENVAYGLRLRKMNEAEIKKRVNDRLSLMGLGEMADRNPGQLSGGQQQRVALARAMVMEPKVLLFDEPLSNLDAKLRVSVREEIRRIQRHLGVTTVYVTHDQEEAMAISDLVVVMSQGQVEQAGSPEQIYREPRTAFVADFIGGVNLLQGGLLTPDTAEVLGQTLKVRNPFAVAPSAQAHLAIRPELVTVGEGPWTGVVERSIFLGRQTEYVLRIGEETLTAVVTGLADRLPEGAETPVGVLPGGALVLER